MLYLSNSADVCMLCTLCYSGVAEHSIALFKSVPLDSFIALGQADVHAALGLKCVAGCGVQTGLDKVHVPYSYGWSIILLTLLVKTALFPITRKQVSSREISCHDRPVVSWSHTLHGFLGLSLSTTQIA